MKQFSTICQTCSLPLQKAGSPNRNFGKILFYFGKIIIFGIVLFTCIFSIPAFAQPQAGNPAQSGDLTINFDDADLYEVVRMFAGLLNINYITEPGIQGKVTIHTAGKLSKESMFPIFLRILEINGLTAVQEGEFYRIIKLKDAPRMPILFRTQLPEDQVHRERIIIQILPLKHISGQEMTKLLTPFISAEGTIISHGDSNTLIVVDKETNILKTLKLVETFDINLFDRVNHQFYRLEHLDAEDMAKTLSSIISAFGTTAKEVKIIPIQRINTIIVISPDASIFDKVLEFIRRLDIPVQDTEPRIYVYAVKNGEAEDLSGLLENVFTGKTTEKTETKKQEAAPAGSTPTPEAKPAPVKTPFGTITPKTETPASGAAKQGSSEPSGTLKGEVRIIPDKIRNALIIEALPKDYRVIENILSRLDVLPRQVLIEVTIAEISLDTKTELGVEWSYSRSSSASSTPALLSAHMGSAGLEYIIDLTRKWKTTINALATEKKINILSSPTILASDNKAAEINVSNEVPIASTRYQVNPGETSSVLQTDIQYKNTGVILSVTPHINEYGLVSMEISQEVSEQSDPVQVGSDNMPSFFKRSVNTTLTVKHGQTIVIGGLIRETKNRSSSGLPCLISIPILQYLFGKRSDSIDKTELILLITPRVIATLEDVDTVTEDFKNKVNLE